jgi:hypothetical protein
VDDAGAGGRIAGGGDPRSQQQAPIRRGEGEEPTELSDVVADLSGEAAEAPEPQRGLGPALTPRLLGRDGRSGGEGYGVISLLRLALRAWRTGHYSGRARVLATPVRIATDPA